MNTRILKTASILLLILFSVLLASGQRHKKKPLPKKKVVKVEAIKDKPWGDQGNGTFLNPVLPGDYSDLDAIRVGTDYYAMSSTFQFSPGVVILHSKDLVNWHILSHVTDNLLQIGPAYNWDKMDRYGKGI